MDGGTRGYGWLVAHIQPTLNRLSAELGPACDIRIGGEV
jgi:hypothetical protein